MGEGTEYLQILEAIERLPFGMGKNLLTDVLVGNKANETVSRHRLDREQHFGCLSGLSREEIHQLLSRVTMNGLIERRPLPGKRYFKVFSLTKKGKEELRNPVLNEKRLNATFMATHVTEKEQQLMKAFGFFLKRYNEEQRHAIVCQSDRILCVAGAGSGKTTVLTKRIEFLTRFCGVPPGKVLAITFTRKAREEMQRRLGQGIQVETFNSFCEKQLIRHGDKLYGRAARMMQYRDKMRLLHHALNRLHLSVEEVVRTYFSARQRKERSKEELFRLFLNDVFSILDYYANNDQELEDFSRGEWGPKMVYNICLGIRQEMKELGLRDYSDQLTDALRLFKEHPNLIPKYDHVLVDEYQDVNTVQKRLLDTLSPKNLFVVGDPRQSIFGWRGSKVRFILDFTEETGTATIVLTKNYRSRKELVTLMNAAIRRFKMPDLKPHLEVGGKAFLRQFSSDTEEAEFIAEKILATDTPWHEIFVLTRTNGQLLRIAEVLKARGIKHVLRRDDIGALSEARQGEVTLSTVHAIKGLEADMVFLAACNVQSFPCKASDHQVLEMVKREEHDREEEEVRLFYVAVSRAKKKLHISYSGTASPFLTNEMKKLLGVSYNKSLTSRYKSQGAGGELFQRLREWRTAISRKAGIPPYMIFPDKTLLQLAEMRPSGMAELHTVAGIGPAKADKYGEELLELVKQHGLHIKP